jgi:hypothetical protein
MKNTEKVEKLKAYLMKTKKMVVLNKVVMAVKN